jgi:hypothetical protein
MSRFRALTNVLASLSVSALLLVGGCSSEPDLQTAVVTGRVTLDGKPLTSGEVIFVPDDTKGNSGPIGAGAIQPDGQYEIWTVGQKGALLGCHRIRVTAVDKTKPLAPWMIPIKYGYDDRSGLTANVKADHENVVDLELKSTQ